MNPKNFNTGLYAYLCANKFVCDYDTTQKSDVYCVGQTKRYQRSYDFKSLEDLDVFDVIFDKSHIKTITPSEFNGGNFRWESIFPDPEDEDTSPYCVIFCNHTNPPEFFTVLVSGHFYMRDINGN